MDNRLFGDTYIYGLKTRYTSDFENMLVTPDQSAIGGSLSDETTKILSSMSNTA